MIFKNYKYVIFLCNISKVQLTAFKDSKPSSYYVQELIYYLETGSICRKTRFLNLDYGVKIEKESSKEGIIWENMGIKGNNQCQCRQEDEVDRNLGS